MNADNATTLRTTVFDVFARIDYQRNPAAEIAADEEQTTDAEPHHVAVDKTRRRHNLMSAELTRAVRWLHVCQHTVNTRFEKKKQNKTKHKNKQKNTDSPK